jgi:hypothetical protein
LPPSTADAARVVPDQAEVVGAFDGSFSRDCTVLALATIEPHPHVWLERIWEAPEGRRDWRVPVVEVEDAIRAACLRYRVLEVAAGSTRRQRHLAGGQPGGPARQGDEGQPPPHRRGRGRGDGRASGRGTGRRYLTDIYI